MVACVTKQGGIGFCYFKVYEKHKDRQKIRIFVDILIFFGENTQFTFYHYKQQIFWSKLFQYGLPCFIYLRLQ